MVRLSQGLAALVLLVLPLRAAAGYLVTDLGSFTATGINNSGQVVGNNRQGAVLYNKGTLTPLGGFNGGWTDAVAINNSGQVVGSENGGGFASNGFHAVLYSGGTFTDLGTLGGSYSEATAINDSGQVVGYALTANGISHAFLYSNGQMKNLGTLGGSASYATGINNAGQIVGRADTAFGAHGFLYSGGMAIDPAALAGSGFTPVAINNSGQMVGYAYPAGLGSPHLALFRRGVLWDIGVAPVVDIRNVRLNDSGQVVGIIGVNPRPFVYSNGVLTYLDQLIPGSPGELLPPPAINDKGQIVANGANGHAYLLTPG